MIAADGRLSTLDGLARCMRLRSCSALRCMLSESLLRPGLAGLPERLLTDWANLDALSSLFLFTAYLFCCQPGFLL